MKKTRTSSSTLTTSAFVLYLSLFEVFFFFFSYFQSFLLIFPNKEHSRYLLDHESYTIYLLHLSINLII